MRYRPLGRTGQFVSEICLGTMTFHGGGGIWRNIGTLEQQASTARRALPRGRRQLHRHGRRLFRGPVRGAGRPGVARSRRQARRRHHRHQGARPHGAGPERRRPLARPHHGRGRRQPQAARPRPHRSLSDPRLRPGDADRRDAARARRPRGPRPRAHDRLLEPGRLADHEGAGLSDNTAMRGSRRCRPTTRSPGATSSARSCRSCRSRTSA